jgi:ADP-heptose:LPS heptosyltransferase
VGREARWKIRSTADKYPRLSQPMWLGKEDIAGKTILVCVDEGIGDAIHFVRYVPMLAARGARVILMVHEPLRRLLSGMAGVTQCLPRSQQALPAFDLHCPISSLPHAFGTTLATIPAAVPYLPTPAVDQVQAWEARLGAHDKLRVGLVWAGNPLHNNDRNRSIKLGELASLLAIDATFISLQKDPRPEDRAILRELPAIIDLTAELGDFADTAALLSCLDVIITVDTSVAHLAGALARPTWILLPYAPDYRWLLDREDSPWYPTVRLFRQDESRDYAGVLDKVRAELSALVSERPASKASGPMQPGGLGAGGHQAAALISHDETIVSSGVSLEGQSRPETPEMPMARIDRELALARKTDRARWSDPNTLEAAWDARAGLAAQFIPAGARVLDLGCGKMALRRFLPYGCVYRGCDLVARDAQTIVCDFNAGEFPTKAAGDADIVVLLGVLEYILDVEAFFANLRSSNRDVVLSYCATDLSGSVDRASLGWMTHFSFQDLAELFDRHGFRIACSMPVDGLQVLMRLKPIDRQTPMPSCSVAVLSYNDAGNFGDRLGYHMINSLLPSEATVHHVTFRTLDRLRDQYDMLVLGIGNSLPVQLLHSDVLLDIIKCAKTTVGVFGTQHRELVQQAVMDRLVERLDFWFARYEDDVMLYGRGRKNVEHLGDWLIDQFPMSQAIDESELRIGDEIWQDLPLDRTIQSIQRHKRVYSTRLHPLLCALTSAEQVAYTEQRVDANGSNVSGKFRSMLIDIFGRNYPENTFFAVDREAVVRYKHRVHRNVNALGARIEEILRSVAAASP